MPERPIEVALAAMLKFTILVQMSGTACLFRRERKFAEGTTA